MNKKIILNILTFLFLSVFVLSSGCKGEDSSGVEDNNSKTQKTEVKTFKYKNKLFSIPSPFHIINLLKNAKIQYNGDLLNPTSNMENYSVSEKKALNLGVYIADLGYTNIYEQNSKTIQYIKAIKKLSSDLQLMNSNSLELITEIEENFDKPDSLNKIFANTYREIDLYLKDNDRNYASTLIITGGWIEGLFLMTQAVKVNQNELLINRIGEQKYSISNLLKLMGQVKEEDKNTYDKELLQSLKELNELFNLVYIEYNYEKQIVSPKENKTVVISETKVTIPDDVLNKITIKTESIRNTIIK